MLFEKCLPYPENVYLRAWEIETHLRVRAVWNMAREARRIFFNLPTKYEKLKDFGHDISRFSR